MQLIIINAENHTHQIAWSNGEKGAVGLIVGPHDVEDMDEEGRLAAKAIGELQQYGERIVSSDGEWVWYGKQAAKRALSAARKVLKTLNKQLPDWAQTAIENGWKAPKGWSP